MGEEVPASGVNADAGTRPVSEETVAVTTTKREPFERILSPNVKVYFGYKDGHAHVRVRTPVGIWYPVDIPADAILKFKQNFDRAHTYGLRPEAERTMEKPEEFEARYDCRGRWGYKDAHVELGVRQLVWFWISFPFDEFILAKKAMDEAHLWAELPEHVREIQGAD